MLKGNVINLVVDEHFAVPRFCEKMKKLQVIVAEVRKKAFQFKIQYIAKVGSSREVLV